MATIFYMCTRIRLYEAYMGTIYVIREICIGQVGRKYLGGQGTSGVGT